MATINFNEFDRVIEDELLELRKRAMKNAAKFVEERFNRLIRPLDGGIKVVTEFSADYTEGIVYIDDPVDAGGKQRIDRLNEGRGEVRAKRAKYLRFKMRDGGRITTPRDFNTKAPSGEKDRWVTVEKVGPVKPGEWDLEAAEQLEKFIDSGGLLK